MKSILSILSLCLLLAACSNSTQKVNNNASKDEPRMVGNDRDEHGCIPSAGYQWSVLRNECVRLFEVGIRLDAKGEGADQTLSAFAIFKASGEDAQAEIHVPNQAKPVLLDKAGPGTWRDKTYTLKQAQGTYTLVDVISKKMYQGGTN